MLSKGVKLMKKLLKKIKNFFKWIWTQIKDVNNLLILLIVVIVLTAPTWLCGTLGYIFNSSTLIGVAVGYIAFWIGPATPFWPLCITITLTIRKIIEKTKNKNTQK